MAITFFLPIHKANYYYGLKTNAVMTYSSFSFYIQKQNNNKTRGNEKLFLSEEIFQTFGSIQVSNKFHTVSVQSYYRQSNRLQSCRLSFQQKSKIKNVKENARSAEIQVLFKTIIISRRCYVHSCMRNVRHLNFATSSPLKATQ